MKDFVGKVAVVTGATRGIGQAIAERCITEGMNVVLAAMDKRALRQSQERIKKLGGRAIAVPTDVSRPDRVEALLRETLQEYGAVHLLVNNAGWVR